MATANLLPDGDLATDPAWLNSSSSQSPIYSEVNDDSATPTTSSYAESQDPGNSSWGDIRCSLSAKPGDFSSLNSATFNFYMSVAGWAGGADDQYLLLARLTNSSGTAVSNEITVFDSAVDGLDGDPEWFSETITGITESDPNNWCIEWKHTRIANMAGDSWAGTQYAGVYVGLDYNAGAGPTDVESGHIYYFN